MIDASVYEASRAAFDSYCAMDEGVEPSRHDSRLQVRLHRWVIAKIKHNDCYPQVTNALGINEEVGELTEALDAFGALRGLTKAGGKIAHICLKNAQRIRGYDNVQKCREEIADALADIAVFSMQLATCFRLDYWTIVRMTAEKVMKRDWSANPLAAHVETL